MKERLKLYRKILKDYKRAKWFKDKLPKNIYNLFFKKYRYGFCAYLLRTGFIHESANIRFNLIELYKAYTNLIGGEPVIDLYWCNMEDLDTRIMFLEEAIKICESGLKR
jgi:hypothetical protein